MSEYRYITYEELDEGRIARITLDRPRYRNAQHRGLLVELDEAFVRAEQDDTVRVVVLAGNGPVFSSGHDMGTAERNAERDPDSPDFHPTYAINGATRKSAEKKMLGEYHYFYGNALRWRKLRKITIAQVQGPVFAAALTLIWPCDLIVAADNASFTDPVGVQMGMCGVEYFGHPWEFGPRRAKEMLLTGKPMSAQEAERIGMVNRVVPLDELAERTLELAREVARRPTMTALMIKDSVNQMLDQQGFTNALEAAFTLHQLNHAHWAEIYGGRVAHAEADEGAVEWKGGR